MIYTNFREGPFLTQIDMIKSKKIWCDGSATLSGDRKGGSGVYIRNDDGTEEMYSIGWINTKTGRAELHALLLALQHLKNEKIRVDFYFDSEYVRLGVKERVWNWKRANWYNTAGRVKNRDLWEKIIKRIEYLPQVIFHYHHIKGHQDNLDDEIVEGNNIADYLANYKTQEKYYDDEN